MVGPKIFNKYQQTKKIDPTQGIWPQKPHSNIDNIPEKFKYESSSRLKIISPIKAKGFFQSKLLVFEDILIKP